MPTVTVHCIRHAQGYHNLCVENHGLTDPKLTPHGEKQCTDLRNAYFPPTTQNKISLIAASPLTRTLHTAYITFQPLLDATHPDHKEASTNSKLTKTEIVALPDAQETSDFPCDTGSEPSILAEAVSQAKWPVDLTLLKPDWTNKALGTRYSPHSDALKARARDTRIYLRQKAREILDQSDGQTNIELVLVTHGGYLHYFTNDWEDATKGLGTGWVNCETRAYQFEAGTDDSSIAADSNALLVETQGSRERRGKTGPQASWEAQKQLFELTMQGWEASGLQRPDQIGLEGVEWKSGLASKKKEEAKENKTPNNIMGPGQRQVESANNEFDLPMPNMDDYVKERSGSTTVRAQA